MNRLLKLSSRKHKDLRSQLQEDTKRAEAEKKQEEEKSKKDGSVPAKFDADPYFKSFMLACQSGSSKLVENSLDFCQKLVSHLYRCPACAIGTDFVLIRWREAGSLELLRA